jgi:hypothetical protein
VVASAATAASERMSTAARASLASKSTAGPASGHDETFLGGGLRWVAVVSGGLAAGIAPPAAGMVCFGMVAPVVLDIN